MRKVVIASEIPNDYDESKYVLFGYLKGDYEQMLSKIFLFHKSNEISNDDLLVFNNLTFKYCLSNSSQVVKHLNNLINSDYSISFWEIIINPWWIYIIQYFHFQKSTILKFIKKYEFELLEFTALDEESFNFNFKNTGDFISNGLSNPDYNHWVISRIIEKIAPPNIIIKYIHNGTNYQYKNQNFHIKNEVEKIFYKIQDIFFPNIVGLYNVNILTKLKLNKIFKKLNYNINSINNHKEQRSYQNNFFDSVFDNIWQLSIPESFFNFKTIKFKISGSILFDSSQVYNDKVKIKIAHFLQNGIPIFSIQHGGHNYGSGNIASFLIFDYLLAHVFIKWGNYNNTQIINNSICLPYQKLSRRHFFSNKILKDKIIWIGSHNLSFFFRYDSNLQMSHVDDYRRMKINFFTKILNNSKLKSNFVFRPYFYFKDGINDSEFFKNEFPDLIIYDQKFEFDVYCHAKLLIMDHPGTTLNYAFARNIPTICIWKNSFYKFTDEALEIFLEMKRNNLLFNDEKFLYEFLDSNVDIYSWWFSNNVQSIVSKFNFLYSSQDSNWIKEWSRSLR